MKRLLKKAGLAFIFLQVLFLNQAYASLDKEIAYKAYYFILLPILNVGIPNLIALVFLLKNLKRLGRALILVAATWLGYFSLGSGFQIFTDFPAFIERFYVDFQWEPLLIFLTFIYWVPITFILLLTIVLYSNKKYHEMKNED